MNGKEKQRLRRGRKAETMLRARTRTEKDVFSKTERLKQALETADAVLIGAGAGLSASAGFTYSGERFHRYFSDFEAKYGFHDMYSGGFYAYPTPEEHWAYWSRYIQVNRYEDAQGPFTIRCTGSYPKKIILYSRPMWTTVFRKRVLIKNGCFIHRAITVYSSAASRVTGRPMITGPLSCAWWKNKKTCASPPR